MEPSDRILPGELIDFAIRDPAIWGDMPGCRVIHKFFGDGTIISYFFENITPMVRIKFDKQIQSRSRGITDEVEITLDSIKNGVITVISPPDAVVEKIQKMKIADQLRDQQNRIRLKEEAEALAEFKRLREKYLIKEYYDSSPVSPLFRILKIVDEDKLLDQDDINFLEQEEIYSLLALYYERLAEKDNPISFPVAAKFWRKANNPRRALKITENVPFGDNYFRAMVLTTRGGAFRDLHMLSEAIKCGEEAIRLLPDKPHPYNLLAAIYYQSGVILKGEEYFEKAIQRGSLPFYKDQIIMSVMEEAEQMNKRKVADFLIKKDAVRYAWAKKYL